MTAGESADRLQAVFSVFMAAADDIQRQQRWLNLDHCDLALRLFPMAGRISVSCELTATVTAAPEREILAVLGIPGMNEFSVDRVTLDKADVEYTYAPPRLTIRPAAALVVGQVIRLGFVHSGTVDSPKNYADPRGSELMGEGFWLPMIAFPMHRFSARARIETPAGDPVAFTGRCVGMVTEGDRLVSDWETEWPVISLTLVSGPFVVRDETVGAIRVRIMTQSGYDAAAARLAEMTAACLVAGSDWYGDLPLSEITLVQPWRAEFGEYAHMPFVVYALGNLPAKPDDASLMGLFEATGHELGHFWWANTVGSDVQTDGWLSEGFADFTKLLALELVHGPAEAQRMMRQMVARLDGLGELPPLATVPFEHPKQGQLVRRKGGLFLQAMRERIGDGMMKRFLRTIFAEFRGQEISTEAFIARATELIPDGGLRAFLMEHLYGTPSYAITPDGRVAVR